MTKLTTILILTAAFLSSSFSEQGKWIIDPESRIIIHGATNLNTFACGSDYSQQVDTLEFIQSDKTSELLFFKNTMSVPVRSFDCGHKQVTKDFLETLKSEQYPHLDIKFRSLQRIIKDKSYINGVVDIILAGANKRFVVRYYATFSPSNTLLLKGIQTVNFSDFKLKAPHKMMGLIQVQECLEVEFNLILKPV